MCVYVASPFVAFLDKAWGRDAVLSRSCGGDCRITSEVRNEGSAPYESRKKPSDEPIDTVHESGKLRPMLAHVLQSRRCRQCIRCADVGAFEACGIDFQYRMEGKYSLCIRSFLDGSDEGGRTGNNQSVDETPDKYSNPPCLLHAGLLPKSMPFPSGGR